MRTPDQGFDHATMAQAFATDEKAWVTMGLVDAGSPDNAIPVVEFDDELGPLVQVTVQPYNIPLRCRVAGSFAGDGEASYRPFVQNDEVIVVLPMGEERDCPTIIGRCNNAIDKWPTMVGGNDATKNTFAFDRTRTPYVFEAADSWLLHNAPTGAFISVAKDGKIVISNGDKAFIALNPDFIGMQDASGSLLLQIDVKGKAIVLQAGSAQLQVGAASSAIMSTGPVSISGYGAPPNEHATSAEALVNMIAQALTLEWAGAIAAIAAIGGTPLTGTSLANALTPVFNPGAITGIVSAAIAAAATGSTAAYSAAIAAALVLKPGLKNKPSVGCAGIQVG